MTDTSIESIFSTELSRAYKPLTHDEETITIVKAQNGCIKSRNAIINSQLKKLAEIARSHLKSNNRCDVSELMAVGISGYQGKNGLHNAIQEFDITKGYRFITFAFAFMKNPIRDYSLDNKTIRVPRNLSKSNPRCPTLVAKYTEEAELHGMELDEYIAYRNSKCNAEPISLRSTAVVVAPTSINLALDGESDGNTLEDIIADESIDMDTPIVMEELDLALKDMDKEEKAMLREYYWQDRTLQEMGNDRGVSRQAVDNRLGKILIKAKKRYGAIRPVSIKG